MTSALKNKTQRLNEFLQALADDPFIAKNQVEAHKFLKKHLDAVELAALPQEKYSDYTVRMNIPSFELPEVWARAGTNQKWEAFGHVIQISDAGDIDIKTTAGAEWFSRAGAT